MKAKPLSIVPVADIPLAQDVPTDNLLAIFRVITQMEQVCNAHEGIGLSAVQVGVPWKLFIVQRNVGYEYYINCEYVGVGDKSKSVEGCLSLRDEQNQIRRFEVDRYSTVVLKGKQLKINDKPELVLEDVNRAEHDLYAVVFQHEIDHQNNVLISDCGTEIEFTR